jgi:hypothetical protein
MSGARLALTVVEWFLVIVLMFAIGHLGSLLIRDRRRRRTRSYIDSMRLRGLELLFQPESPDVMSGLQLLARFGLPTPIPPPVLARCVQLTQSTDSAIAALEIGTLKRLSDVPVTEAEGATSARRSDDN